MFCTVTMPMSQYFNKCNPLNSLLIHPLLVLLSYMTNLKLYAVKSIFHKKESVLPFETTCIYLESVMLNEMSDRERQIPSEFTYTRNLKNKINNQKQTNKKSIFQRSQCQDNSLG